MYFSKKKKKNRKGICIYVCTYHTHTYVMLIVRKSGLFVKQIFINFLEWFKSFVSLHIWFLFEKVANILIIIMHILNKSMDTCIKLREIEIEITTASFRYNLWWPFDRKLLVCDVINERKWGFIYNYY